MADLSFPNVSLQTLAILRTLGQRVSAGEVAKDFKKSVSAVTRKIKKLEKALGVELVESHSRGMKLTPAGDAYARAAGRVLDDLKRTQNSMNLKPMRRTVHLRGYVSEALLDEYIYPTVAAFMRNNPHVAFDIIIGAKADAEKEMLTAQETHAKRIAFAALFGLENKDNGIQVVKRVDYPLIAVVSFDHPLADRKEMTATEVISSEWPVAIPPSGYSTRGFFENILRNEGFDPQAQLENFISLTVNSPIHLIPYAMTQQAIVILPEFAARKHLTKRMLHKIQITGAGSEQASFALGRGLIQPLTPPTDEEAAAEKAFFDELKTVFDGLVDDRKRHSAV